MKRNCSLEDISDGRLFSSEELAELGCNGCKGAALCCHGMGNSIILDPYDSYRLMTELNMSFEELLAGKLALNVVDGIILPNLKMTGEAEACAFLNGDGKCSIHASRPGICRLFPLGRHYEKQSFHYFLQKDQCPLQTGTKVRINKWIETSDLQRHEQFLTDWHYFLNEVEAIIKNTDDDQRIKNINLYLLGSFYMKRYDKNMDFYDQFYKRLSDAREVLED